MLLLGLALRTLEINFTRREARDHDPHAWPTTAFPAATNLLNHASSADTRKYTGELAH